MSDEPPPDGDKESASKADDAPEVEGAVPAEPTQASVDVAEAEAEADAKAEAKAEDRPVPVDREGGLDGSAAEGQRGSIEQPSAAALVAPPATFPDDGNVSRMLRKIDNAIGLGEQAALFTLLGIVVLVGGLNWLLEKTAHFHIWFSHDVSHGGTFWMATFGVAYATQQQRHLAMDLISKSFPPRARLILAAVLEVVTIVVACVMVKYALSLMDVSDPVAGEHLLSQRRVVSGLAFASVLFALHATLHLIIHIDYIARGKLPPERTRSAH